jgi:imidazolonepropionase-like amidohydrolase
VLVRSGRVVAVGARLPSRDARVVEAAGMTLMPALHDLHTHLRAPGFGAPEDLGKAWAGYLLHGVGTVADFSVSGAMIAPIRRLIATGAVAAPHLRLAVRLGVPGGHGTEYGWARSFTLEATTPAAAARQMRTAIGFRPDAIKVFADGWRYGRGDDLADMDQATLSAIVARAHAAGLPVITHSVTLAGAKRAARAGVDALGHGVGDAPVDAELIRLMKARGTAYVPTLVVYEPQATRGFSADEWRTLRPAERRREEVRHTLGLTVPAYEATRWRIMQGNVRRLHAAGVRIAVGTDAGIGGVFHGSSTLREVTLLTRLGLTPAQALAAATSGSSRVLRRPCGRIASGQRADLVLLAGRPDVTIEDLHAARRVWIAGREVPLERLRHLVEGDVPTPLPRARVTGPVDLRGALDGSEGGPTASRVDVERRGDALSVTALMGARRPVAIVALPLTPGAILPADARGFDGVAFDARGEGGFRLVVEQHGRSGTFAAPFTAGPVRIPFAALTGSDPATTLDLSRLRQLIVRIDGDPGTTRRLTLSRVRFYRSGVAR